MSITSSTSTTTTVMGPAMSCCCWVVATLEQVVRPDDAIGRLGGDEFAVLFAEIEPADALESAARIGAALSERAPCSLGLATFPMDGCDLEELCATRGRAALCLTPRASRGRSHELQRASQLGSNARPRGRHAHERPARALTRGCRPCGCDRSGAWLGGGDARNAPDRGDAPRCRQGHGPDSILCKPGRLTEEEFALIQGPQHRRRGAGRAGRGTRDDRSLDSPLSRELRWLGLPRWSSRRGDPAGVADHARGGYLRCDHEYSPLPRRRVRRRRPAKSSSATPAASSIRSACGCSLERRGLVRQARRPPRRA